MSLTKRAVASGGAATPTSARSMSLSQKKRGTAEHHSRGADAKVSLDRVLGITCYNSNLLSSSESTIAYPAGCVAVLFHPKKRKQIHVRNKKPISCLTLSPSGNLLATGERGHEPCVRVWDISTDRPTQVAQLKGHNFGVACVLFSPNQKNLISIGYQHDRQVLVWNWKNGSRVVHGKFASPVNDVAFSHNHGNKLGSNYFVTVHHRRVQYWYYDTNSRDGKKMVKPVLTSRSVLLGELQENHFVAVACGKGPLSKNCYVLTKSGRLCLFDDRRRLDRFTEVKATAAHSLALSDQYLFCGCSEGVVRIFDPYTLDYIITMPLPHTLGVNVAAPVDSSLVEAEEEKYPDSIALTVLDHKIAVVYNDHSFYIWDLSNIQQIGKTHSYLFHSACVWDICVYPRLSDESSCLLPPSCFVTCSSDNTIRFWCLDGEGVWSIKNHYSKDLIRVLYSDPLDTSCLKDLSNSPGDASAVADTTRGIRCIQIHPNGQHIATGDRLGNIRVYDLHFMDKIYDEVAHDSEILSLTYSPEMNGDQFLASASRDRMVHIFMCPPSELTYQPVQSLPDHSAAVTAIKFAPSKDSGMQLLSSGADKSIIFHSLEKDAEPWFQRSNHIVGKATIYDMDVDPIGKHILTAGQDKFLRIYLVSTGKQRSAVKAPTSDDGSLIKVSLDPSGLYAAASSADKSVVLFDIFSGECVTKLYGHSEIVTQIAFSQDCKYLYTVSGDSCIFVWRLSREITQNMHERLLEMGKCLPTATPSSTPVTNLRETYCKEKPPPTDEDDDQFKSDVCADELGGRDTPDTDRLERAGSPPGDFQSRISELPPWAQKQMLSRPSVAEKVGADQSKPASVAKAGASKTSVTVEGKWAESVERDIPFASQEASDSDTEIEDLTSEMTRVVSEQAFDATDAPEEEGAQSDSPEASDVEEVLYVAKEQTDIDPMMFKVTTPTMVKRQISEPEGESADEADAGSPDNSPPLDRDKEFTAEEALFLKKNFESLEKSEGPFLQVPNPRLSISAKFLERSMQKHLSEPSVAKQQLLFGSPDLIEAAGIEAAGIVVTVQDVNNVKKGEERETEEEVEKREEEKEDGDKEGCAGGEAAAQINSQAHPLEHCSLAMAEPEPESDVCVPEEEACPNQSSKDPEISGSEQQDFPEGKAQDRERPPQLERSTSLIDLTPSKQKPSSKRRQSFEEDIGKTRKRLEELGYLPSKELSKDKDNVDKEGNTKDRSVPPATGSRKSARIRQRGRQAEERAVVVEKQDNSESTAETSTQQASCEVVSGENTEVVEESSAACASDSKDVSDLTDVAKQLLEAMEDKMRELVALNDQAIDKIGQEAPDEGSTQKEVIRIIASGVNSIKSKLVTMTNKNKKMWRAVAKNTTETVTSLSREQFEVEAVSVSPGHGRYNLRSTPTRQQVAAASRAQRQAVANKATVKEEEEGTSGSCRDESTDKEQTKVPSQTLHTEEEAGGEVRDSNKTLLNTDLQKAKEPSSCNSAGQQEATVTVSMTELEKAKEMAQHLTALISNLEHQQSSTLSATESLHP